MKGENKTDLLEAKLFGLYRQYCSKFRLGWNELGRRVQRARGRDRRMMRHIHLRCF